jgi:formate dehydrogenase assembly factor FdhD
VALTYNDGTHAVMMTTQQDLAAVVGAAGITLAAIARVDGFEVFTHPYRILFGAIADAAGR